jgi:hypothetical protein
MKTLVLIFLVGCGGATGATRTAYSIEIAHCAANEHEIVVRQGTTRVQDEHDLAVERERCNAALHAIETHQ